MKPYHQSEDHISVLAKAEADSLADQERDPTESHHHSSRKFPHFQAMKVLDSEGSWLGLVEVIDKRGNPLPKELTGQWTDIPTAVRAITLYLENQKKQKETEHNAV